MTIEEFITGLPKRIKGEREVDYLARLSPGGGMFAIHEIPSEDFLRQWRRGADYVYFMFDIVGRGVKIGRARSPMERRNRLSGSGAVNGVILAVARDGNIEGLYHRAFAEHRIAGEWFEPHSDILAEIDRLTTPPTDKE